MADRPALSDWARKKEAKWGKPIPAGLAHGTRSHARYVYGCDCATCIPPGLHPGGPRVIEERPLTRGERYRRSRRNLYGKPVPANVKHGIYARKVYGCSCPICRKALIDVRARRRGAWREKARGHWVDLPSGITVLHWPPGDTYPGWRCPDCGEQP